MDELSFRSNLNRSFSAPDISKEAICRRVYVEEFYYNPDRKNPMVRHYSTEQLIGLDDNKYKQRFPRITNTTTLPIDYNNTSFNTSNIHQQNNNSNMPKVTDSPMDIDTDHSSHNISVQEPAEPPNTSTPTTTKKLKIKKVKNKTPPNNALKNCKLVYRGRVPILTKDETKEVIATDDLSNKTCPKPPSKIFKAVKITSFLAIIAAIVLVPQYDQYYYNRIVDVDTIYRNLKIKLINQGEQIDDIRTAVNMLNYYKKVSILNLIGTTGVGKTYSANIIKQSFKSSQVFDIDKTNYIDSNLHLYRDLPYLINVDNLKLGDMDDLMNFIDSLPEDRAILVINIFNIQDTVDHVTYTVFEEHVEDIYNAFKQTKYNSECILFNRIGRDIVKKYIRMSKRHDIDYVSVEQVIDDHDFGTFGFKGFVGKLKLIPHGDLLLS